MANRRDFLKGASLLTLGALFSNCAKAEAAPKGGGPLGLQIYSLGPELSANGVAEGLKRIKESGYSYIELAGYRDGKIGQVEMAEYKKMADDAGIEIISSHLNPPVRDYSKDNFEEITREGLALVDFWATWCGPCRMQAPVVDQLDAELGGSVKVCKVDVDAEPALARKFRVMSIPTLIALKDGQIKETRVGYQDLQSLKDMLK